MRQIICPNCGPREMCFRIQHLARNVGENAYGEIVEVGDARVTYEGRALKCPTCNSKVKIVDDDVASMLDELTREIENTEETIEGFLMHEGTTKTILSIIAKHRENLL